MNTTHTFFPRSRFSFVPVVLWALVVLAGCKSLETRLQEAETEGRLDEAFRLSVEYYDDNRDDTEHEPAARAALERVGNVRLAGLISMAERAMSNDNFTETISLLYEHPVNSAAAVIRTAEARGVQLVKRNVPDAMRSGVYTALDAYYQRGLDLTARGNWHAALAHFNKMKGLKDADRYIAQAEQEIRYADALAEFNAGNYRKAYAAFGSLPPGFRDAAQMRSRSLELGRFTVAIFGFTGDRSNLIREKIMRRLMQDVFIEVLNGDNLARLTQVSAGAPPDANVRYVVNGSTALTVLPPCSETLAPETEAWVVTDKYRQVDSGAKGKRYLHVARPLDFLRERISVHGTMTARYDIADARKFTTLMTNSVEGSYNDDAVVWTYSGSHDPERFTTRNPLLDTLTSFSSWSFSSYDRSFQKNFLHRKQLAGPHEIAASLLETVADKTADAVVQNIYTLEERRLSVAR